MRYFAGSTFGGAGLRAEDGDWTILGDEDCEALLVWRRTDSFRVPRVLWFRGSRWTGDHQFRALSIFFDSLMGLEPVRKVHLSLYSGPTQDSPGLLSCLESIRASGCQELHCRGGRCPGIQTSLGGRFGSCTSSLRVLCFDSPLLFTHRTVSFTVTALHNASLQRLTLTNTALTPGEWTVLLTSLKLPQLTALEVEAKCPIPTLISFLLKHQVQELRISPDKCHVTSGVKLRPRPRALIPSLKALDAPAEVIITLMRFMDVPTPFPKLGIRLRSLRDQHLIFPVLMDCTEKFPELEELRVTLEDENGDEVVYAVPEDERICSAKSVVFHLLKPENNPDHIVSR